MIAAKRKVAPWQVALSAVIPINLGTASPAKAMADKGNLLLAADFAGPGRAALPALSSLAIPFIRIREGFVKESAIPMRLDRSIRPLPA